MGILRAITKITKTKEGYDLETIVTTASDKNIVIEYQGEYLWGIDYETLKEHLLFSKNRGTYVLKNTPEANNLDIYGSGFFPYKNIQYNYEASNNLDRFQNSVMAPVKYTEFKFAKHFPYTFGIEYETSGGFIPQEKLFSAGLIPLRDGSISGIEYSTVVLKGNEGLSKIKEHCKLLKEYTVFNQNCSLHMHFGNFPIEPKKIYALYVCCYFFQDLLITVTPNWAFNTEKWKSTGKNYCKLLPILPNFHDFYTFFVGFPYMGNLYQNHPRDIRHERKWQIPGRYYWINFINMLCFKNPKTVEFRFMRPTYCPKKIIAWIKLFNILLRLADEHTDFFVDENLKWKEELFAKSFASILETCLGKLEYKRFIELFYKFRRLKDLQSSQGDNIGETYYFDRLFFS